MNDYGREQRLFKLLIERIEEEQAVEKTDGVDDVLSVLLVHVKNLGRLATGTQPDFIDYEELIDAVVMANELVEALLVNHAEDLKDETSQAARMCALLVDVRADLEKTAWDVEDSMPQLRELFSETRAEKFVH